MANTGGEKLYIWQLKGTFYVTLKSWKTYSGLVPSSETNFQDYSRTQKVFSRNHNAYWVFFSCWMFPSFKKLWLLFPHFEDIPGPPTFFKDFSVLENAGLSRISKNRTRCLAYWKQKLVKFCINLAKAMDFTEFSLTCLQALEGAAARVRERRAFAPGQFPVHAYDTEPARMLTAF